MSHPSRCLVRDFIVFGRLDNVKKINISSVCHLDSVLIHTEALSAKFFPVVQVITIYRLLTASKLLTQDARFKGGQN